MLYLGLKVYRVWRVGQKCHTQTWRWSQHKGETSCSTLCASFAWLSFWSRPTTYPLYSDYCRCVPYRLYLRATSRWDPSDSILCCSSPWRFSTPAYPRHSSLPYYPATDCVYPRLSYYVCLLRYFHHTLWDHRLSSMWPSFYRMLSGGNQTLHWSIASFVSDFLTSMH